LQALNRQTGAPRFNDPFLYIAAVQLGTWFRIHSAHSANLPQPKPMHGVNRDFQTRALPHFCHCKLDPPADRSCNMMRSAARAGAKWMLNFPQVKREAFASRSCSGKGPDRDDHSMKMRQAL
jgi:hypothetical protein